MLPDQIVDSCIGPALAKPCPVPARYFQISTVGLDLILSGRGRGLLGSWPAVVVESEKGPSSSLLLPLYRPPRPYLLNRRLNSSLTSYR
jgi:hypothetical protein